MNRLIDIQDLSFAYDEIPVLSHINLCINKDDFWVFTGSNGGGKTSLVRIMLHLLQPSEGSVCYYREGIAVKKMTIGYLPQKNLLDFNFPILVKEVVLSGLLSQKKMWEKFTPLHHQLAEDMIERVGLKDFSCRPIGALSGGQQQRVLLARAMVSTPQLLVLDEPTSYLDKAFENNFYPLLQELNKQSTIVVVSHQLDEISKVCKQTAYINHTLEIIHHNTII